MMHIPASRTQYFVKTNERLKIFDSKDILKSGEAVVVVGFC